MQIKYIHAPLFEKRKKKKTGPEFETRFVIPARTNLAPTGDPRHCVLDFLTGGSRIPVSSLLMQFNQDISLKQNINTRKCPSGSLAPAGLKK